MYESLIVGIIKIKEFLYFSINEFVHLIGIVNLTSYGYTTDYWVLLRISNAVNMNFMYKQTNNFKFSVHVLSVL